MKLGPPPPPLLPPVGPAMTMVPLLPTCTSEADHPQRPVDAAWDAPVSETTHRHSHFRHATSGKALSARGGSRPGRAALKRRRRSGASGTGAVESGEFDEWCLEEISDDYEVRRHKSAYALRSHSSQRDDAERGNRDEGHRLERHFAAIRNASGEPQSSEAANRSASSRAAALEAALGSRFPLHATAMLLASQARAGSVPGSSPGLSAFALLAARRWLARQGFGLSGGTARLADIRTVLMAAQPPSAQARPRQASPANLWLPIFLLNLDRPRTASQRHDGMERSRMLERMMSRRGGP